MEKVNFPEIVKTDVLAISNTKANHRALKALWDALEPDEMDTFSESYGFQPQADGRFGIEFRLPTDLSHSVTIVLGN